MQAVRLVFSNGLRNAGNRDGPIPSHCQRQKRVVLWTGTRVHVTKRGGLNAKYSPLVTIYTGSSGGWWILKHRAHRAERPSSHKRIERVRLFPQVYTFILQVACM